MKLSGSQILIRFFSSKEKFKAMEEESRLWGFNCENCNERVSIWDIGGVRYKAAGKPKMKIRCPKCMESAWQSINRLDE